MKVLWLCNIILPEIAKDLGLDFSNEGGWLIGLSNDLKEYDNVELSICFPIYNQKNIIKGNVGGIKYYGFPQNIPNPTKYNPKIEKYFSDIIEDINPDIIHIFGTEYPHTLSMVNVCENLNCVEKVIINIQGLCSIIEKHYFASLPAEIINKNTFRDFFRRDNIKKQQLKFSRRGEFEIKALKKVSNVIGRTNWDFACTKQINSNIKYYKCNETLRSTFYGKSWSLESCEKHSIFVTQASYPIKGLHTLLEALPIIKSEYPNVKVYIAGIKILENNSFKSIVKSTTYSKYLKNLINEKNLSDNVVFTGPLNEEQICEQFLKANVFASLSSIENESNSVSEAKILGVPVVASYVGGVIDRISHGVDGFLFQHDAPYMLAHYIMELFGNNQLAESISRKAKTNADLLHNKKDNTNKILEIYKELCNKN